MKTSLKREAVVGRESAEACFHRLYSDHGRAVLAYAIRRSGDAHDAADVVSETFLVAWRRFSEVPTGDDARLWLFGVARRLLANQHRAERRRVRLAERLGHELPAAVAAASVPPSAVEGVVLEVLGDLCEDDREILLLSGWEQLEPAEIAHVLGISRVAARSRLHRARARLRAGLTAPDQDPVTYSTPNYEEAR